MTPRDIEHLYRQHARRLRHVVGFCIGAPEATIDDACHAAWSRLIDRHREVSDDTALAWMARTAMREATRLSEEQGRTCSLEAALAEGGEAAEALLAPSVEEIFERRRQLGLVGVLPLRQQRFVWMVALGLSYAEIAAREGCTLRTVERQILRARHAARRELALTA